MAQEQETCRVSSCSKTNESDSFSPSVFAWGIACYPSRGCVALFRLLHIPLHRRRLPPTASACVTSARQRVVWPARPSLANAGGHKASQTTTSNKMEVVRKAADAVRNSPLFRRRFGQGERREDRTLHPDRDLTPFVQGLYYKASKPMVGRSQHNATPGSGRVGTQAHL